MASYPYALSYQTPEQYAGKSLEQINQELIRGGRGFTFRPDIFSERLGIDRNAPLEKGKYYTVNFGDEPTYRDLNPNLSKLFGQGVSPEIAAAQPAIKTLQEGKQPLEDRYKAIIESLKGKETEAVKQAGIGAAQEFGKRGIPLSSGAYTDYLQNKTTPITTAFSGLEAETGLSAEQAQQSIRNAIAQLQAGAGSEAAANALARYQLEQNQKQFESTQGLSRDVFSQISLPESLAKIASGYFKKDTTPSVGLEDLWAQFGG